MSGWAQSWRLHWCLHHWSQARVCKFTGSELIIRFHRASKLFQNRWPAILNKFLLFFLGHGHKVYSLFVAHTVPDSIASNYKELGLRTYLSSLDIGVDCYSHFLLRKRLLFVLPITNGSTNSETSIDPSILNMTSCSDDPLSFSRISRFVIVTHLNNLIVLTNYASRVTWIRTDYTSWRD